MAAPPNFFPICFPEDEGNRFFLCGFCGNHILDAIWNNFFFRINWTAPNGVELDGILCKANTPSITTVLTQYGRPVVNAYCNNNDCSEILGVKFISSGRVLNELPVEVYIGRGQEAVFLDFGWEKDDLLYWNGEQAVCVDMQSDDHDD